MPEPWMPGARVDPRSWTRYAMNGAGGSVRAGLHTTENGQGATCDGVADYMADHAGLGTGYSMLYHPTTGDVLQLRPADVGAGSLKNLSGGVETNRNGRTNIQIAVVAYAAEDWARAYPCPRWPEIVAWLRSWGVPDAYVHGPYVTGRATMPTSAWTGPAHGWYGHQHVPENDHTDPGPQPDPWTIGTPGAPTTPPPTPPSGGPVTIPVTGSGTVSLRMITPTSPITKGEDVRAAQQLLALRGHSPGKIDGQYGTNSQTACRAFQTSRGLQADAWIGANTWNALLNG